MLLVRLISIVFIIMGTVNLSHSLWKFLYQRDFIADAGSAKGEVTGVTRHVRTVRKSERAHFTFQVRFATASGEEVEGTATEEWPTQQFRKGQAVPVAYAKANPRNFRIFEATINPKAMGDGWSAGLLGSGLIALWYLWWRRPRTPQPPEGMALVPIIENPPDRTPP